MHENIEEMIKIYEEKGTELFPRNMNVAVAGVGATATVATGGLLAGGVAAGTAIGTGTAVGGVVAAAGAVLSGPIGWTALGAVATASLVATANSKLLTSQKGSTMNILGKDHRYKADGLERIL